MVIKKKIATEAIPKEMIKIYKHFITKNSTKNKKKQLKEWGGSYKVSQVVQWHNFFLINNYFKCKWIKLSNQKMEIGRMDKITWFNSMLSTSNSFEVKDTKRLKVKG